MLWALRTSTLAGPLLEVKYLEEVQVSLARIDYLVEWHKWRCSSVSVDNMLPDRVDFAFDDETRTAVLSFR